MVPDCAFKMYIPRKEGREAGMQVEGFKVADQKFPSPKSLNIDLMFLSCLNIGQITFALLLFSGSVKSDSL